ncbi:MAG TPA: hypothetical protein VIC61_09210 [Gammaproteobacteria bacterium]
MAAAVLHAKLRLGLGLPGHHGLEWMTALLFARCASGRAWACLIVGLGAATAEVALTVDPGHLPKAVSVYLLTAALVDVLYRATPPRLRGVAAAALIAALVYGAKPAVQLAIAALAGIEPGFMRHGTWFPIVTHVGFGLVGGACGAILARGLPRRGRPEDEAGDAGRAD